MLLAYQAWWSDAETYLQACHNYTGEMEGIQKFGYNVQEDI